MRPRPYLSFSQMTTFEQSEDRFLDQYVRGKKQWVSINMTYGSKMANGLETGEATGDPLLDLAMARVPKLGRMDLHVEDKKGFKFEWNRDGKVRTVWIPVLKNGGDDIPILAIPDAAKPDYTAFKEDKTSVRPWTQKMVNDSGQITFYSMAIWLAKGFIPKDIELIHVETEYSPDGKMRPTGNVYRIPTTRNMVDIIKMTTRAKEAWAGIKALCERELL